MNFTSQECPKLTRAFREGFTNLLLDVTKYITMDQGVSHCNIDAWNARIPTFIRVIENAYKWNVIDGEVMHSISVTDVEIVRPMSTKEHISRHHSAFEEGSLTCKVYGTMVYTKYKFDQDAYDEQKRVEGQEPPGFFYEINGDKLTQSFYRLFMDQKRSSRKIHIGNLPCLMWSDMDHQSTEWTDPTTLPYENLAYPFFIESRLLYTIPIHDTFRSNQIRVDRKRNTMKVLSSFYNHERECRTNWTMLFQVVEEAFHSTGKLSKAWTKRQRFMFKVPHLAKDVHIPLMVLAMAYGMKQDIFVQFIRMFIPKTMRDHELCKHYYDVISNDTNGCETQGDALIHLSDRTTEVRPGKHKYTRREKKTFESFSLMQEFFPGLKYLDEEFPDYDTEKERFRKFVDYENYRKGILIARLCAELICNTKDFLKIYPWESKSSRDKAKRTCLLPCNRILLVLREDVSHLADSLRKKFEKLLKKNPDITTMQWSDIITSKFDIGEKIPSGQIVSKRKKKFKTNKKQGASDTYSHMVDCGLNAGSFDVQNQYIKRVKLMTPKTIMQSCEPHPSEIGRECAFNTSESDACGTRRPRTIGAYISPYIDDYQLEQMTKMALRGYSNFTPVKPNLISPGVPVICTRNILRGWVDDAVKFYKYMVNLRRLRIIPFSMSIAYDAHRNLVRLDASEGRELVPYLTAHNFKRTLQRLSDPTLYVTNNPVNEMMTRGCLDYLDAAEEYCSFVRIAQDLDAFNQGRGEFSHFSIPLVYYSAQVLSAHTTQNMGTRIMFSAIHRKGALEARNYIHHGATQNIVLWHAERSLVQSPLDMLNRNQELRPVGNHVVVAFIGDDSNIEDSFVLKKSTVDRGLGMTTIYKTLKEAKDPRVRYCFPDNKVINMKPNAHYYHRKYVHANPDMEEKIPIRKDGMPEVGVLIHPGEVIISRSYKMMQRDDTYFDVSRLNRFKKTVKVEKVYQTDQYIQIVVSYTRKPVTGNKGYFGFGHKGTFTIKPSEDLPFVTYGPEAGMIPDVLITPNGAWRQTNGMWRSGIESIVRAISPESLSQYETVFNSKQTNRERLEVIRKVLVERGYHASGRVHMTNGQFGIPLRAPVFLALLPLELVKHMAPEKISATAKCARTEENRTMQGRSKHGGIKVSNYAKKSIYSHGVPGLNREFNYNSSPLDSYYHCTRCQSKATGHYTSPMGYFCSRCGAQPEDGVIVQLPLTWVSLWVIESLKPTGVNIKFEAAKAEEDECSFMNSDQMVQLELVHQMDKANLL